MKKIICMILSFIIVNVTALAAPVNYGDELQNQPQKIYEQTFQDVPKSQWAFSYIAEMVDKGVINGYPDGLFRPDNQVQRAEFAKIMVNAAGLKATSVTASSFYDVTVNDWYCPYVETAKPYLTGYVMDGRNMYLPETAALREDIAVALVRLKGYDISVADLGMLQTMFSDYDSISVAAKPYIAVAVERGLISGYEDGTFKAQNSITRAESAALLWRANQYGNDNKVINPTPTQAPTQTTPTPTPVTEQVATAKPSPTATIKPQQTAEPTPEPEKEKPFVVDTMASNLSDITDMVATKDGVAIISGKEVKTISLNGQIISKGEIPNYVSSVYNSAKLAYDVSSDTLYVLSCNGPKLDWQYPELYDVTNDSPQLIISDNTLEWDTLMTRPVFLKSGGMAVVVKTKFGGYELAIFNQGSFVCTKVETTMQCLAIDGKNIYGTDKQDIYEYSMASGSFDKAASLNANGEVTSYDNNFYYVKDKAIYTANMNGKSVVYASFDDFDVIDLLPIQSMNLLTISQDDILFYDSNAKAIRRIMKNDNIKG